MSGLTRERERGGHWHYASHSVRPSLLYRFRQLGVTLIWIICG